MTAKEICGVGWPVCSTARSWLKKPMGILMNDSSPISIVLLVTEELEKLGIPYFLAGSLASALYGVGRSTLDADIVADLPAEMVNNFVSALERQFVVDQEMILNAISRRGSFNLLHRQTMFKVDVFLPQDAFDQAQLERRSPEQLQKGNGQTIFVASAEDTILAKLRWFRLGNEISDRQWQDILGILKLQRGVLDTSLLEDWASRIGVSDLLKKAFEETGIR